MVVLCFFDNKPLIVKAWNSDMDVMKDDLQVLPTWIQMKVDFKYWSERSLMKLASPIGKFVRVDQATAKREKLQYARVLVEVKVDQVFPDQITFINEKGVEVVMGIHYEWKPVVCSRCRKIGHLTEECRVDRTKKVWKPKV